MPKFTYNSTTKSYCGVPTRLGELVYVINLDGEVPDIRKGNISDYVDYIRRCTKYLAFDLEASRREHRYLLDTIKNLQPEINRLLGKRGLTDTERKCLENISRNWPTELRGLTEVYNALASIGGKCTYEKSIKDGSSIKTYVDYLCNTPIKSLDDFIDFLIVCASLVKLDITGTKEESDILMKKLEQQESSYNPQLDFSPDE